MRVASSNTAPGMKAWASAELVYMHMYKASIINICLELATG